MDNLDYKGVRSTRFILALLLIVLGSVFLSINLISQDNWVELLKWSFATYATSEAAAKGAEAYKKKGKFTPNHNQQNEVLES